jgi:rhodanese-related sulfurtransferase
MRGLFWKAAVLVAIALVAGYVHGHVAGVKLSTSFEPTAPSKPESAAPQQTPPKPEPSTADKTADGAKHPIFPPPAPTGDTGTVVVVTPGTLEADFKADHNDKGWFISLDKAHEIYTKNQAIFVDARSYIEFTEGHIPGAMHLDKKYFDGAAGAMKAKNLKGQEIVIYCHGAECTDSEAVAIRLQALQFHIDPIYIIKDGFPGWQKAGYPVDKGGETGF